MPKGSFKSLVTEFKKLISAAEAHELELPSLGPFRAALEEALEDITVSKRHQTRLKTKGEEATQDLNDQITSGRELMRRLKSYAKASFGRTDERLADFGVKPWGRRRRKPPELERKSGSPGYH
jgi:hypothetical protein